MVPHNPALPFSERNQTLSKLFDYLKKLFAFKELIIVITIPKVSLQYFTLSFSSFVYSSSNFMVRLFCCISVNPDNVSIWRRKDAVVFKALYLDRDFPI